VYFEKHDETGELQDDSLAPGRRLRGCRNSCEAAIAELTQVFNMIEDEYREKGLKLPADTTEIVNA